MERGQAVSTERALDQEAQANQAAECTRVGGPSWTSRGVNQLAQSTWAIRGSTSQMNGGCFKSFGFEVVCSTHKS